MKKPKNRKEEEEKREKKEQDTIQEKTKLGWKESWENIRMILRYYQRFTPFYFYIYTGYVFLVSFVWVATGSYSLKFIFDALEQRKSFQEILLFLTIMSGLMIFRNIAGAYLVEYLEPTAHITMIEKLRAELFEKAAKMDLAYYETPKFYTDFVWAASQADVKCQQVLGIYMNFMAQVSELLFLGGLMVALDPVLILFAIVTAAVRLFCNSKLVKYRYQLDLEAKPIERERDYSQRIFYLSDYAKEIRLSEVHKILYQRFTSATQKMKEIYRKGGKKLTEIAGISIIFQEFFLKCLMLLYLSYKIIVVHQLTIGDFAALIGATNRFAIRMRHLVDVMMSSAEAALYIEKFKKFLSYQPSIEGQDGIEPKEEIQPICLKDISFTYEGETKPSLQHINMTIHPLEKIAIVGYNGAGKSTLIKLLMRLYDVTEGAIFLGDTDIRELKTKSYRKKFGAIFQDFQIFAASLGENVAMDFVEEEERTKILEALYQSGMKEKVETLPKGIDTALTKEFQEDGQNFSGGEAQKTAIARVFLRPYHYVIMDEPSSALDPISEYNLNQNMMEIAKDKTVIFISHRLSTTCMADRIYMLEKGQIIEEGTHHELIELGGKYAEMFWKQAGKYQVS